MKQIIGIGIETSCDETSLSIVENGKKILSLSTYSQIEKHAAFRGVVPEIAARAHLEKISLLYDEVLKDAKVSEKDLDYIAVTAFPGLLGSLVIGAQFARCLALVLKKPVLALDHLEAHLTAIRLEEKEPVFPYLGLLLSGGNSSLYLVEGFGKLQKIADTLDDALGEAFDKVGSLLGLPYPSGPWIESKANEFESQNQNVGNLFPRLLKEASASEIAFSFSGIKTAVLHYTKKNPDANAGEICSSFQSSCFELVVRNLKKAVQKTGIPRIVAGGGVLANSSLQKTLADVGREMSWEVFLPEKKVLCTDNAAMVACLGFYYYQYGMYSNLDFRVSPRWEGKVA